VVFISSESGLNIPVEMVHYGFTKTAQISVARGLAKLTRGTGVTVNSPSFLHLPPRPHYTK
jgi:NAD(P)-dependent dehydrogenase (short-subunit alcohol dehydrogenase family)